MASTQTFLVFGIEDRRLALSVEIVERVVRSVEVLDVPDAPDPVYGLAN